MSTATPSDESPAVVAHGVTDVSACVISMSARSADGRDADYIEWHTLDHRPEQYRIAGLRAGTRWVSTPACRAARSASESRFDAVDHVVQYLFAAPLPEAMESFFDLGADLGAAGRMPLRLPPVELGGYRRQGGAAAHRVLVGADVLPWRPARGAFILVEEGASAANETLVGVPGIAGAWHYAGTSTLHPRLADTEGLRLTVCYVDDDVVATARRVAPVLHARWAAGAITPLLAAPFEAVVPFAWDRALPGG